MWPHIQYNHMRENPRKKKRVTFNWVKTWAAALKSHALSCRHLHRRGEMFQIKWLNCQVMSSAADIKSLTSGTIPGSCQTSVRKLWAYLAVTPLVSEQGWKMESGQERQRLGGSPLSLPFEWKAGRWQCTDCCTETGGKTVRLQYSQHFCALPSHVNSTFC